MSTTAHFSKFIFSKCYKSPLRGIIVPKKMELLLLLFLQHREIAIAKKRALSFKREPKIFWLPEQSTITL